MTTELELIYTIHAVVRAGEINQDDNINERLMRSFLSIHRGKLLAQEFKKGQLLPDECFQFVGEIPFTTLSQTEAISTDFIPKIIRLKNNTGIQLIKDEVVISVLGNEEYRNQKKDRFGKNQPKAKFMDNKLTVYFGNEDLCSTLEDMSLTHFNTTIRYIKSQAGLGNLTMDLNACLVNPDDGLGYDFTSSPYPLSDELIENLINSVNAREFNIFLRTKSDEIGDGNDNQEEFSQRQDY